MAEKLAGEIIDATKKIVEDVKNGKLDITTSGDAKEFCVKPTKSTPDINNICWKEIKNSTATITVYQNKKYYIWIKDNKDKISSPMSINTKNEK